MLQGVGIFCSEGELLPQRMGAGLGVSSALGVGLERPLGVRTWLKGTVKEPWGRGRRCLGVKLKIPGYRWVGPWHWGRTKGV